MNIKKYALAIFVVLAVYVLITSLFHVLIFGGVWEAGLGFGDLFWAISFVFLFGKAYAHAGLFNGLKFGLLVGVLFCSPIIFGFFPLAQITNIDPDLSGSIIPGFVPSPQLVAWYFLTVIKMGICGFIMALVFRPVKIA